MGQLIKVKNIRIENVWKDYLWSRIMSFAYGFHVTTQEYASLLEFLERVCDISLNFLMFLQIWNKFMNKKKLLSFSETNPFLGSFGLLYKNNMYNPFHSVLKLHLFLDFTT